MSNPVLLVAVCNKTILIYITKMKLNTIIIHPDAGFL